MLTKSLAIKSESSRSVLVQVAAFSLLIALCAQIRVPLFFTPIPLTLQTFAILSAAAVLGARNATFAALLYVAEITLGLPFLSGAKSNPFALLGPSGGYLAGMVMQAYIAGWFLERKERFSPMVLMLALCGACFLQLCVGGVWLGYFVGMKNLFFMGIAPFMPGEVLKVVALTALYSSSMKR